jgi:hypothetical protein
LPSGVFFEPDKFCACAVPRENGPMNSDMATNVNKVDRRISIVLIRVCQTANKAMLSLTFENSCAVSSLNYVEIHSLGPIYQPGRSTAIRFNPRA